MLNYQIEIQRDDGSWATIKFQSLSDDDAIAHALRLRTANTSKLYQAERWLATFDGAPGLMSPKVPPANDNHSEGRALGRRGSALQILCGEFTPMTPPPSLVRAAATIFWDRKAVERPAGRLDLGRQGLCANRQNETSGHPT